MREKWDNLTRSQKAKIFQVFKWTGLSLGMLTGFALLKVIFDAGNWQAAIFLFIGIVFVGFWDYRDIKKKKTLKQKTIEWSIFAGVILILALIVFFNFRNPGSSIGIIGG